MAVGEGRRDYACSAGTAVLRMRRSSVRHEEEWARRGRSVERGDSVHAGRGYAGASRNVVWLSRDPIGVLGEDPSF